MTPAAASDLNARILAKRRPAAAESSSATPKGSASSTRKPASGGRWQTLNQFVETAGPRLSLAERWVWTVMFKHAKDGVCLTSVRQLATTGISCSTAALALKRLCDLKLVWPIWLSGDKSKPSKYGVHPNPSACLGKLLAEDEPYRPSARSKR